MTALDHDMSPEARLVPLGILELNRGPAAIHQPWILFGHSKDTSDVVADGLNQWWNERKAAHPGVKRLHIELDNGPEVSSSRTQFMNRLVAFADHHRVEIELAHLPPYHSKYNPVERCWGILERHWNGARRHSIAVVLLWAATMTWRKIHPLVREVATTYRRGVRLTKAQFAPVAKRLKRSPTLPKWSLTIEPADR